MFVDIHILQSVPPSNLNRDDTGSPKSAIYGGVRRARVSSQAWKKATRSGFKHLLDPTDLGVRTKRAVELLVQRLKEKGLDEETAVTRATATVTALGMRVEAPKKPKQKDPVDEDAGYGSTQYLVFWSNRQLDRLADLAFDNEKPTKKQAAEAADKEHGFEIAMFGRMVADAADINVDAAVQVAHAISTHAVEIEQDYFTAVDDKNPEEETGAGMIGTVEFNAATLYRYATINVAGLLSNLGDQEAVARGVAAFVKAFALSMPTGKQNTFANRTVPDAIFVTVRRDQPVNLVGAFENAVAARDGYVSGSAEALANQASTVHEFVGAPHTAFVARSTDRVAALDELGERVTVDELAQRLAEAVEAELAKEPS